MTAEPLPDSPLSRLGPPLLCLAAALACVAAPPILFYEDAVGYLSIGANLAAGRGYHSATLRFPDLMTPPLYPALIALCCRLSLSPIAAAVAICAAAQALTVALLMALHRAASGPRGVLVTGLCAAVCPNLAFCAALTLEPLFLCLAAAAALVTLHALRAPMKAALALAALGGTLLAMALLTRPEAVITAGVLALLVALWPVPLARRAAMLTCAGLCAAVLLVPYGLWLRGQTGRFELIPKVRYNVALAEITERLAWAPGEESSGGREQRVFFTLAEDRSTFAMNRAFADPQRDPRAAFPLRPDAPRSLGAFVRAVLFGAREVLSDGVRRTLAFHPLALLAVALALGSALFSGAAPLLSRLRAPALLAPVALAGLAVLHLGPAVLSGADYTSRYLSGGLLFSLPLVGAGAVVAADWLRARAPRPLAAAFVLALIACYALGTVQVLRATAGGPTGWSRVRAVDREAAVIPQGARVLAEHGRTAFLRGAFAVQLPYLREPAELGDFLRQQRVTHAILDPRTLSRNPSALCRALADPARWPPSLQLLATVSAGADPVYLARVVP